MSKHEKQVRRERRKTEQRRRSSAATHGAAALATAAAIAAGTSTYAEPIRFDNPAGPGHFDWAVPVGDNTNWLDVTLDVASQPGATGGLSSFRSQYSVNYGTVVAFSPAGVEKSGYLLESVGALELIPSGTTWGNYAYVYYPGYGTLLPVGSPTYLGVRFNLGSGTQYGWIGVVQDDQHRLDAFAWGYETEPGVAIPAGAPEPGSLALLAMGAVGVLSRRRR